VVSGPPAPSCTVPAGSLLGQGTLTATVDGFSIAPNCIVVRILEASTLLIQGQLPSGAVANVSLLQLAFPLSRTGSFSGTRNGYTDASISFINGASVGLWTWNGTGAGQIEVTASSPGHVVGNFEFTTDIGNTNGQVTSVQRRVTNGRFDVSFSGS
jgi:hypothetical protein